MLNKRSVRVSLALCVGLMLSACWTTDAVAPVFDYGQRGGAGSTGIHTIAPGDTVGNLAQRYNLALRDILSVNGLQPPYQLVPGQRLKLPAPQAYTAKPGDTLYSVSHMFNTSSSQIVRLNMLSPPYALQNGQVLKLPLVEDQPEIAMAPIGMDMPLYTDMMGGAGGSVAMEAISLPAPIAPVGGGGGIEREELSAPTSSMPMQTEQIAPDFAPAPDPITTIVKIPDITPPRSSAKFLRPVDGALLSSYGSKPGGLHNDGVNIKAPIGTPVRAAENGVVVYASNDLKGFGNLVLIRHADKWMTAYAHMDQIDVQRGATVKRGQSIGTVGSSGNADGPQLHFEVRRGTEALNPEKFM